MIISVDTETTGADIRHGCRPFFVATINDSGEYVYWQWDVNPKNRRPIVPKSDVAHIQEYLNAADTLVLHNTRFDFLALQSIGVVIDHLWEKVEDTLVASHVHNSLESHKLKDLAIKYLDLLDDDQKILQDAVNRARNLGRRQKWDIARASHPHFPAQIRAPKDGGWAALDMWLPAACVKAGLFTDPKWADVLQTYALRDVERTIRLWKQIFEPGLAAMGLVDLYREQRDLIREVFEMEAAGVTIRPAALAEQIESNKERIAHYTQQVASLARMPKINLDSPKDRQHLLFTKLNLPIIRRTKEGASTDKETLVELLNIAHDEPTKLVLKNFQARNEHVSNLSYLNSYNLFTHGQRLSTPDGLVRVHRIYPNFNQTGTKTTRFSSNAPNLQNVSKKVKPCTWCDGNGCDICGNTGWSDLSLRKVYGPAPSRLWISADYSNIEMRILALEAKVESFLAIFRRGESVHMAVAKVLYPKSIWADPDFKKTDYYRSIKNGNFAISYGAGPDKANATYKIDGAYSKLYEAFPDVTRFQEFLRELEGVVRREGVIKTLGGYPLGIPRDKPYAVLNYFVQGSAGIVMKRAMVRCGKWLRSHPEFNTTMNLTIHDELVFDAPDDDLYLDTASHLRYIMESPGDDFGIPLPVEPELHRESWAKAEDLVVPTNHRMKELGLAHYYSHC